METWAKLHECFQKILHANKKCSFKCVFTEDYEFYL